ncbi:MAG TPA: hypothetical protein VJY41_09645 [Prolixibacteraceae bacterium]|nr:hypothetical protein [Prolixibacteraceae bacterium]
MKRKEFINYFARYGIVGAIVFLTGFLLLKREVKVSGRSCSEMKMCKSCKKYQTCALPEKK